MKRKPKKPRPDFPLYAHRNGQWAKKIRGRTVFFGPWNDPDAALAKHINEKDDLHAGRQPQRSRDKPTTADIINALLKRSENRVRRGELSAVTFADYVRTGRLIVQHLGRKSDPEELRPVDFAAFRLAMAGRFAPTRLSKVVSAWRSASRSRLTTSIGSGPLSIGSSNPDVSLPKPRLRWLG